MRRLRSDHLPIEPLQAVLRDVIAVEATLRADERGDLGAAELLGVPVQKLWDLQREDRRFVSVYTVDELCCALGKHPIEVYGISAWIGDVVAEDTLFEAAA